MEAIKTLGRRDKSKDGSNHKRDKSRENKPEKDKKEKTPGIPGLGAGLGSVMKKKPDPKKILSQKLEECGRFDVVDKSKQYALDSEYAKNDLNKACELAILYQDTLDGKVYSINPTVDLQGAVNRKMVTCWLDANLTAMFCSVDVYDKRLHSKFKTEAQNNLSFMLRLWVNMFRTGRLIDVDITQQLQEAIAKSGWDKAADIKEQDASEAYSEITNMLELPLLQMKKDLYHQGIEGDPSDHGVDWERIINVAIPDGVPAGRGVTLEDCLDGFLNTEVVIRREKLAGKDDSLFNGSNDPRFVEKGSAMHVDDVEEVEDIDKAQALTSMPDIYKTTSAPEAGPVQPFDSIRRRLSRKQIEWDAMSSPPKLENIPVGVPMNMPAFLLFNLLPFSTDNSASNDQQVAEHLENEQPVIVICIKRYAMVDGKSVKNDTHVDIPPQFSLPNFVGERENPLGGRFKLVLQSVICHDGDSVHSGHYFSYLHRGRKVVDGDSESPEKLSDNTSPPDYSDDVWLRHNDLKTPKVSEVLDFEKEREETIGKSAYMLFYQVRPLNNTPITHLAQDCPSQSQVGSGVLPSLEENQDCTLSEPPQYTEHEIAIPTTETYSETSSSNDGLLGNGKLLPGSSVPPLFRLNSDPPASPIVPTSTNTQEGLRRRSDGDEGLKIPIGFDGVNDSTISINSNRPSDYSDDRRPSVVSTVDLGTASPSGTVTPAEESTSGSKQPISDVSKNTTDIELAKAVEEAADGQRKSRFGIRKVGKSRPTSKSRPPSQEDEGQKRNSAMFTLWKRGSKDPLPNFLKGDSSQTLDKFTEIDEKQPRRSLNINFESSLLKGEHNTNFGRSKSKKEKKRSKSKTPRTSLEENNRPESHSSRHKGKGKEIPEINSDQPDRTCTVM